MAGLEFRKATHDIAALYHAVCRIHELIREHISLFTFFQISYVLSRNLDLVGMFHNGARRLTLSLPWHGIHRGKEVW